MTSRILPMLLLIALVGCGGDDITKVAVTGKVTLDEQPLEEGTISFIPSDGVGPTADGMIQAGEYSVEIPPGAKRVEIRSSKVTGQRKMYDTPDSPMVDVTEEVIPSQYNVKSQLKAEVGGEVTFDFPLKSKP